MYAENLDPTFAWRSFFLFILLSDIRSWFERITKEWLPALFMLRVDVFIIKIET